MDGCYTDAGWCGRRSVPEALGGALQRGCLREVAALRVPLPLPVLQWVWDCGARAHTSVRVQDL